MEVTRTFDLLELYKTKYANKEDALAGKENREWVKYSSRQYVDYANNVSCGLLALGIKPGDIIATICNNCPEWNFLDMGIAQIGAIHLPIFTTLSTGGYEEILKHAEAKLVIVSDKSLYNKVKSVAGEIGAGLYSVNPIDGAKSWKEIVNLGKENSSELLGETERIKNEIKPTDWVTLIYTSGTTGNSKGVMLSHQNLVSTAKAAAQVFNLQPNHRYLSILPLCHVGERMGCYQTQISGCSIYYAQNVGTIASDLLEIKPHGFGAVPRILEKVYDKIINKGEKLTGIKKRLFFWALDLGLEYKTDGANGWWYEFQLGIANKIIFSKWREAMGGNVISIGIGGAALQPRLERVFWAAGIKLLNMYGLTETSPIITINRGQSPDLQLGTVGAVIKDVEVRIADDGEILCKGPNVMLGYYKDDDATKAAIDKDGWLHTGDIGKLIDGKFLKITDRKKEIFKLSNGKYVSPQAIENILKESIYIDQPMVVGEGEKFTSAIISPNFETLKQWCKDNNIEVGDKKELIQKPEIAKYYNDIVNGYNKLLSKDEMVKRFRLVSEEWTPDTGELSPTLKLKRKVLLGKYGDELAKIYGKDVVTTVEE
ncbi:MAG: long-chain fatty acid--CoA ligase [Flavobacteriales bacterium]|nr:MAG: long-chain fatty acid--CoA ligase [Flavobacteriales bacterium]